MRSYEHGGDVFAEENRPVDFSVNIDPLGMPEAAARAAERAVREELSYPDPFCRKLTAALSGRYGVPAERIVCGNGASDLLIRLCSCTEPEKVLVPAPGFSEYARCAELFGAEVKEFKVLGDAASASGSAGLSPLESIISCSLADVPDMIFICRPNNPDGSLMSLEEVKKLARFCERRGILLVCDECFLELAGGEEGSAADASRFCSAAQLTEEFSKLIVINAFTKTYAMAGLRLGFMFCSDADILDGVYSFGSPWSVSAPAQAAGAVCCGEQEFLERARQYIAKERKRLVSGLEKLGLEVFPSLANFLLVRAPESLRKAPSGQGGAKLSLREMLSLRGIKVRDCRTFSGLDDSYVRIGVRTEEENTALLGALKEMIRSAQDAPEETNG